MSFVNAYKRVKPSIVAICGRISSNPHFPDIIGTGVIFDSTGLILTNSHVVKAINKLPRRKDAPKDEWPAFCYLFHFIPDKGMATIPLDIVGVGGVKNYTSENFYGDIPDIGIIKVNASGLPAISIPEKFSLEEGQEVAVAGFPMGTTTLKAPGWLHQIGPSLKIGHVSAILPFVCNDPHAILIDSIMQGGNSGSPVFDNNGNIVGILYGGLNDLDILQIPVKDKSLRIPYRVPTNLSYAVPNQLLNVAIKKLKETPEFLDDKSTPQTLEELLKAKVGKIMKPKVGQMYDEVINEEEIIRYSKDSKISKK